MKKIRYLWKEQKGQIWTFGPSWFLVENDEIISEFCQPAIIFVLYFFDSFTRYIETRGDNFGGYI